MDLSIIEFVREIVNYGALWTGWKWQWNYSANLFASNWKCGVSQALSESQLALFKCCSNLHIHRHSNVLKLIAHPSNVLESLLFILDRVRCVLATWLTAGRKPCCIFTWRGWSTPLAWLIIQVATSRHSSLVGLLGRYVNWGYLFSRRATSIAFN